MLQIDKSLPPIAGVPVYGDDSDPALFYAFPAQPRFRVDEETGEPIFMYLKYKTPHPRPDGSNGGGLATFDVEFALTPDEEKAVLDALKHQVDPSIRDQVRLGSVTWASGTAHLNLSDVSNTLVSKVWNPKGPSLYGTNITPFTVELPDIGATLFADALQGKGGIVQVAYGMNAWVKLPEVTGWGHFNSSKFYDYVQDASDDSGWGDDSFSDTVHEQLTQTDVIEVHVDTGAGIDPDLARSIYDSIYRTVMDEATKRMASQIAGYTGDRSVLDDYESIHREYHNLRIDDFTINISQHTATLWPFNPQGTLPNITNLRNKSNQPVQWSDHYREIDLDDPFYRTVTVTVQVDYDLSTTSPVDSVDVLLTYHGEQTQTASKHCKTSGDVLAFTVYKFNDNESFDLQYTVNYKGSDPYVAPVQSIKGTHTVSGGDLGVLDGLVRSTLDYDVWKSAEVTVRYAPHAGPPIEETFLFNQSTDTKAEQHFIHPVRERVDQPISYEVAYTLKDSGTIINSGPLTGWGEVVVSSPLKRQRVISVRGVGDFDAKIDTIYVDLVYDDQTHGYHLTQTVNLSKTVPFMDWKFYVFDPDNGTASYQATVRHKDGTVQSLPVTPVTGTIFVGDIVAGIVTAQIEPDLVDWTKVKLVKVSIDFATDVPEHAQHHDVIVRSGDKPSDVVFAAPDAAHTTFSWTATYYLADGSTRATAPAIESSQIVLPVTPPAG
jgi:hypothetical protein